MPCRQSGNSRKIRRQTLQLVSQLSRWCQVREDLLYAFEKCLETGLDEPMNQAVHSFLTRVQGGMSIDEALDLLQKHFEYEHFQELVIALRFNFRFRGDLPQLIEHLEMQFYRIEEEYDRRKISTARDRRLSWLIVMLGPALGLFRLASDPVSREVFFTAGAGQLLLLAGFLLTVAAAAGLWLAQRRMIR